MLLGCIGDDFTGSSDLANVLTRQGMHTVLYTGVPKEPCAPHVEAGIVALKTRSVPVDVAVRKSLDALDWLKAQGCRQFVFKYCSTFDSTPEGNIGPVADALMDALGTDCAIVCPAFPGTGRTVYQGHLFVNDRLLDETGMRDHPLTPMTDADIRRWIAPQTRSAVGHVSITAVLAGATAIRAALDDQRRHGRRMIVVDAIRDADLVEIGKAAEELPLVTGASGIVLGLPANFARQGLLSSRHKPWRGEAGKCVAIAGSCSVTTRQQIDIHGQANPVLQITVGDVFEGKMTPAKAAAWLLQQPGVPLAYSSADPDVVAAAQKVFGREASAELLEDFFAEVAAIAVKSGVGRLLVAGGETSGAVVEGLELASLEIGPEIDPGVPALRAGGTLVLALKSGNFGSPDYFSKAAGVLGGATQ